MGKIRPENYPVTRATEFFFDTNIWILIFAPNGDFQKGDQQKYSKLFENILEKDAPIYINSIIISEFANALLRRDYNIWKDDQKKIFNLKVDFKKDYFGTSDYLNSYSIVKSSLDSIFSISSVIKLSDNFSTTDMAHITGNCPKLDFNDSYISHLVNTRKFNFVSNDTDFHTNLIHGDFITTR
ncbi:hypothetical protein [Sphingobacterium sp. MYb388]|uniref:hypothetical protein n=1 Tax=Sphingobacterium sp. MYb388 TaxID=2745437 RepID=UPI0030B4FD46